MTNSLFPISEESKIKKAEKKLKDAKPLVVASTKNGIVFVTENPSIIKKTAEIYHRLGLGAIGSVADIKKIKAMLINTADKKGFSISPDDVNFLPLVEGIANVLEEAFEDPQYTTLGVIIALAEIGSTTKDDKILSVDYEGGFGNLENEQYVVVSTNPDPLKEKIQNLLGKNEFHNLDTDSAIELIKNAISQTRENDSPTTFEVSILKRSNHQARRFKRLEWKKV